MPKIGWIPSGETRKRMSEAAKRRAPSFLGKKHSESTKNKLREAALKQVPYWLGKTRSSETIEKIRIAKLGKHSSPQTEFKKGLIPWNKGKKYGVWIKPDEYNTIHGWLKYHFGKASLCENTDCPKVCLIFQWALKDGFSHARNRLHYAQLCISCHKKYDLGKLKIIWKK